MNLRMCLAPLVMVGFLQTIQTSWHSSKDISGGMAEIQTCKEGLGGRMAFSPDMVQIGPSWGISWPINELWSFGVGFHGGLGYSNTMHPDTGVRQITKWNGGLSLMVQYSHYVGKIGYDHNSNGRGIDPTNHGIDHISYMMGYVFP
jgi:hypothetical protein